MIEKRISLKIQILSVIAFMFVVLQHSSATIAPDNLIGFIWRNTIAYGIADYPVSFFFLLSDFFLSLKVDVDDGWYLSALRKCIRTLGLPYLLWCMIGWCLIGLDRQKIFLMFLELRIIFRYWRLFGM